MHKKILLVEDEALIALAEAQMLQKQGYKVVTAHSGEKAVAAVEADPDISLILMDIDLGRGIDGTEAAERILADRDLPIVFLSSHTEAAVVEKTEKITSYGYVVKNSGETVLNASIKMAYRLWESEDKFRKAFEYTSVGMVLTSPAGELLQINEAFASMLGYSPAEIFSVTFSRLIHPEDTELSIAQLKTMIEGKTDRCRFTKRYIRKDGAVVWADINTMLLRDSEGTPLYFITHAQDITESKLIQAKLEEQRKQYDLLLRSTPTPIAVVQDDRYVYCNHCAAELLGYTSPEELINTPIERTIGKDSLKRVKKRMQRLEQGRNNHPEEITILRKDGGTLCCESTSIPITFNSSPAGLILSRDLTRQKQAEQKIRYNEAMYRNLMENSIDAVYLFSRTGKILDVNQTACAMLGYSRDELLQLTIDDLDPNYPSEQFIKFWDEKPECATVLFEAVHKRKDGRIIPVEVNGIFFMLDGKKYLFGVARDISERKEAEKALHESEEKFRKLFDLTPDAALLADAETGQIALANNAAEALFEIPIDRLLGMNHTHLYPEELRRIADVEFKKGPQLLSEPFPPLEMIIETPSGVQKSVELRASAFHMDDKLHLLGTFRDITRRIEAEKSLHESSTELDLFFSQSLLGFFFMTLEEPVEWNDTVNKDAALEYMMHHGHITRVNQAMLDQYGAEEEDFLGITPYELFAHDPEQGYTLLRSISDSRYIHSETNERRIDGTPIVIEGAYTCIYDEAGRIIGNFGVQADITDRTRTEVALRESISRYDELVAKIPVGVYILWIRANGRKEFDYVSDRWCAIHKLRREDVIADAAIVDDQVPSDEVEAFIERNLEAARDCKPFLWEGRFEVADGEQRWLRIESTPVLFNSGDIRWFGITQDITERKKAEEELLEALSEKEFLMKELNHRVKNSLLMVSSLISLKNAETEVDLSDIQHQIKAISLIHEKLYRNRSATEISFREYINDLLSSIFSSFSSRPVRIAEDIDDTIIPAKLAVSLGLIVNEIATNAIKHGFSEKEEAQFSIAFTRDDENQQYILTLSNTGKPFPEEVDPESTETLGLRLINALVSQIEGALELTKRPEPEFTIRFPL